LVLLRDFSFTVTTTCAFFQIAELKRGAEIIVCTPGRMIDMLAANNGWSTAAQLLVP